MATDDALVAFQESVEVPATAIIAGEAEKEVTPGTIFCDTATEVVAVVVPFAFAAESV